MRFREYRYLILSDLYRATGSIRAGSLLRALVFGEGFKFIFWFRTCNYAMRTGILKFLLYPVARLFLCRMTYKFGISIPPSTVIGSGFYIGHFGGIVVNGRCKIGKNFNISHGVTLGQANRGSRTGVPTIGDNVYIGPGAKIIGAVTIGSYSAIGANCVVTKDVPEHAVVVGVPGRVISLAGSREYVHGTDYERFLG